MLASCFRAQDSATLPTAPDRCGPLPQHTPTNHDSKATAKPLIANALPRQRPGNLVDTHFPLPARAARTTSSMVCSSHIHLSTKAVEVRQLWSSAHLEYNSELRLTRTYSKNIKEPCLDDILLFATSIMLMLYNSRDHRQSAKSCASFWMDLNGIHVLFCSAPILQPFLHHSRLLSALHNYRAILRELTQFLIAELGGAVLSKTQLGSAMACYPREGWMT